MTLIVCPLHEVEETIRIWRPSHIIGLASPGAEQAVIPAGIAGLQLTFHDIAEPHPDLQAVSAEDVDRLLAFARDWPRAAPLLIQCWAGVSRSPAAAYVIACMLAGPGREDRLAKRLRETAPFATPNPRLVALADQALGRRRAMVEAVVGIGRGGETSLGRTFELPVM